VVGVVIVVAAAYTARSVALAGFGLDTLFEIFASVIVVWQLLGVNQRPNAALLKCGKNRSESRHGLPLRVLDAIKSSRFLPSIPCY
jgi:hypothetical protein